MTELHVERFALDGGVPAVEVRPSGAEAAPICLFLYGGGGSAETLVALAPLLERAWTADALPPLRVACAGVPPFCFYLDDPETGAKWETVVARHLLARVRADPVTPVGLVGISMGGYGALSIAFARPDVFRAVAAVAPMIEPSLDAHAVPLRNRFHYPPDVPQRLLGAERDAALYPESHPAHRARQNAEAIRAHDLAVFVDAGSRDALNAHDGAEFLHRVLWDLDVRHEYVLHRDADHVGPTIAPRLERAFAWVGRRLSEPPSSMSEDERSLRAMLAAARAGAADDPTLDRVYGLVARD